MANAKRTTAGLMTEDDRAKEIALAEYKEVVTQFRTLTDIRFKLLTYLPLGTVAAAVFVPPTNDLVKQPAIPAFAFVVTLCIATYNKRNDQHYDELVSRAAELERELQIEHGSFSNRPKPWLKYGFVPVEHRWPIGLIYAAAASLWAYLFAAALVKDQPGLMFLKFTAPAVVIACWQGLRWMESARRKKQRAAVKCLMGQLLGSSNDDSQGKLVQTIAAQPVLGIDKDVAKRRVAYHWKGYEQKRDSRAASVLLSAVIDLPARWIEDIWSGRR
ncbi:MAG TPA: hypothetical protein VIX91_25190 [Candidatus Acidoferrum sp.]